MNATVPHRPHCVAPRPLPCFWCDGCCLEPDEDAGEIPCLACSGSGVNTCEFVLLRSRTHKHRAIRFDPATSRLEVTQGRKVQWYTVVEFAGDPEYGRAFALAKADGTVYQLRCGSAGVDCSCAGETYLASAKANQRAWEAGEAVYPTYGCCHLDALVPLLNAGWLDLTAIPEASLVVS